MSNSTSSLRTTSTAAFKEALTSCFQRNSWTHPLFVVVRPEQRCCRDKGQRHWRREEDSITLESVSPGFSLMESFAPSPEYSRPAGYCYWYGTGSNSNTNSCITKPLHIPANNGLRIRNSAAHRRILVPESKEHSFAKREVYFLADLLGRYKPAFPSLV